MRDFKKKYESSDFVMTPEDTREAQKQIEKMLAERKIEQAAIKATRDEKLQSIGIDASDDYFLENLAEVRQLADSVQKQVVEEAAELLEQTPDTSVAVTSVIASESASIALVSEAPVQVTPTSNLPQCDSLSNLFSLERHLGGEITKLQKRPLSQSLKRLS